MVPYSAGRPGTSRCPTMRTHSRSSSVFMIEVLTVTPRTSSISPRVIGWRYATSASVSSSARE